MRATYEWQTSHGIWLSSKIRISYLPLVYLSTLLFRAPMKMFAFFCFSLTKTIILANIIICKRFKNEWHICSLKRSANNHWFQWFWLRTADVFGNATNANFIKYKWPVKSAHNFFSPVNTHVGILNCLKMCHSQENTQAHTHLQEKLEKNTPKSHINDSVEWNVRPLRLQ